MTRIIRLLGLALLAFVPLAALHAEEKKHPDLPMLWKVEGKGLTKPSWLFGTIHIGEGPISTLHPAAEAAFKAADTVYTEVPMDMTTQVGLALHFIRKDSKTLSDSIGAELSKQLDLELAAINPQLDSTPFQSFKTWTVAVTLPMLEFQLTGGKALDSILWDRASEEGKTTSALEKPVDQFGIFDDLSEEEQIIFLSETLRTQKEARETKVNPTRQLVEAYISGDAEKLQAVMEKQIAEMAEGEHAELGKKLLKRLFDDRNRNMAKVIAEKLTAEPGKSHFFAVGTGHYLGKENIGELLTKQGYKVTRITD